MPRVDLVVNCFERTYRDVLSPGFFPEIERQNRFAFTRRVALLNNIEDAGFARRLADERLTAGELDAWYVVAEELPRALERTGLTNADLGPLPHYSDCALVAVTLPGSPWLVYWDAEIALSSAVDWIGPALELMKRDRRVLVANPRWHPDTVEEEAWQDAGDFALGYGFSDQVFLARRDDLGRDIYHYRCLPSLRYPLSCIGPVFEARVDAFMRTHRRLRATYRRVHYRHTDRSTLPTQWECTFPERIRRLRNRLVCLVLAASPVRHPCWKI